MAKFCPIQILGPHPNGKNATGHHLYLFTDMHIKILIRSIMRIRLHRRFTIPGRIGSTDIALPLVVMKEAMQVLGNDGPDNHMDAANIFQPLHHVDGKQQQLGI
ncbi:hypothetical protein C5167_046674 [Papaver somniferum]|uniref:Uncharacterized protein n=1 Tax=Papaver somniferum TaxID=3469 RepID=A0A4Y7LG28_PAPSO|nr:hypothetical protein C5167_046674 [Papaver somniferum]